MGDWADGGQELDKRSVEALPPKTIIRHYQQEIAALDDALGLRPTLPVVVSASTLLERPPEAEGRQSAYYYELSQGTAEA